YAGDIGPGGTYAAGYNGPDLVHFMYIDVPDLTGKNLVQSQMSTNLQAFMDVQPGSTSGIDDIQNEITGSGQSVSLEGSDQLTNAMNAAVAIQFPFSSPDYPYIPLPTWGARRAQGTIQEALGQMIQQQTKLEKAID